MGVSTSKILAQYAEGSSGAGVGEMLSVPGPPGRRDGRGSLSAILINRSGFLEDPLLAIWKHTASCTSAMIRTSSLASPLRPVQVLGQGVDVLRQDSPSPFMLPQCRYYRGIGSTVLQQNERERTKTRETQKGSKRKSDRKQTCSETDRYMKNSAQREDKCGVTKIKKNGALRKNQSRDRRPCDKESGRVSNSCNASAENGNGRGMARSRRRAREPTRPPSLVEAWKLLNEDPPSLSFGHYETRSMLSRVFKYRCDDEILAKALRFSVRRVQVFHRKKVKATGWDYRIEVEAKGHLAARWSVDRCYEDFCFLKNMLRVGGRSVPMLLPDPCVSVLDEKVASSRVMEVAEWVSCLLPLLAMEGAAQENSPENDEFESDLTEDVKFLLHFLTFQPTLKAKEPLGKSNELESHGLEDLVPLKVLGRGSFGKVILVRKQSTGSLFALKIVRKSQITKKKQLEHTLAERRVLGRVAHPFIVDLKGAFHSRNKLFMLLEYCPGGDLFYHLSRRRRFSESQVQHFSSEIICALAHLHEQGIIYRDLKPENILLDADGHIKLVDFGLAKEDVYDVSEGARTLCGSPEYLAPEIAGGDKEYGTAVDWWALGMVMYEMCTGLPPWYSSNPRLMAIQIQEAELEFPPYVSGPVRSLIAGLLERDPKRRLGSNGGPAEIKSHPFFDGCDWRQIGKAQALPPFRPCDSIQVAEYGMNFDSEFSRLPIGSFNSEEAMHEWDDSEDFAGFAYEAPTIDVEG